ncbi:MAG: hypothetical protein ACXWPS_14820 [Ktedonobacteraceae bacterium]
MGITQILHTFTGQGLHEFTILSIVLALIGTLFISYELLGRQFRVLRIALQIITPALATALPWILCILLFLWFPSYQKLVFTAWLILGGLLCLYLSWSLRSKDKPWQHIWIFFIARALASVVPWLLLIWIYLKTNQAATFEIFSIVFATIAGMIGTFHGVIIAPFETERTANPTSHSQTVVLKENQSTSHISKAERLKDSSKQVSFRLLQFLEGFIAGFIFVSVFWFFILTLVFGFAGSGFDTLVGSAIVGGLGGIAGGLWRGFFHLPDGGWKEVKEQLKSFLASFSQFTTSFLKWLKSNPLSNFLEWITTDPNKESDTKNNLTSESNNSNIKEDIAAETIRPGTEERAPDKKTRPVILDPVAGKFGFRLWLWASYIFVMIATGILIKLEFLLSSDQQAALVSIGISQQDQAFLVQVVASVTVIVGFAALVVGPISGWFAAGISKITNWSILDSPAKNVAVFGLFLTLIAFMLQLVEPLASLSHTTFHDVTLSGYLTPVDALAWSPDGNYIASGSINGSVRVWNAIATTNTTTFSYVQVSSFKIDSPPRTHYFLTFLAWSPDNTDLVIGTSNTNADEGTLQIWNAMTGKVSFNKQYRYGIFAVAWSPDETRLAWGDMNGHIYISDWNVALTTNTWDITTKKIYTCTNNSTQQEWDPITSRFVNPTLQVWNPVTDIAWSPDSSRIVAACPSSDTLQIHDVNTGKTIVTYDQSDTEMYFIAWSPDGKSIAAVGEDNTVRVWKANNGHNINTYNPPSKLGDAFRGIFNSIDSISWSPDSSQIASSSEDGTVQVWDAFTGDTITTYRGHISNDVPYPVLRVAWSPVGNRIASSGVDETVQVWEVI